MDLTKQRIGFNQATFRDVNEDIKERTNGPVAFRCECAMLGCNVLLELSRAEYEAVREHPRRFVIAPGHEEPAAEKVVERRERYFIVEKVDEAGELAERTDPRNAG